MKKNFNTSDIMDDFLTGKQTSETLLMVSPN